MKARKNVPELRFPGFEDEWEEKSLGELGYFKNGINKSKDDFGYGSPFVNLMDVFGKDSISSSKNFGLVKVSEKELSDYNILKGDVLFIRSSVKPEGVGLTAVVMNNLPNTTYSGFLLRFRENKTSLSLKYKKYCFRTYGFRNSLISKSTVSANTNINQESLISIFLSIPTLAEQTKIADFLSDIDLKIEKLSRKKELMMEYKRGMMQKLFSREIRFKDEKGEDYPDWEEKRLGEVIKYTPRKIDKPTSGYWRLGLRSHCKGTFHTFIDDPSKIDMDELYVVKENDLIVNITFAWEHAIAVADSSDDEKLVSHRFPTYVITPAVYVKYMKYLIAQSRFRYELENISPGGVGRNRVMNKSDFMDIIVFLPTFSEQEKIANFLSDIDLKIEQIEKKLRAVKEFKKGLLQKMFV